MLTRTMCENLRNSGSLLLLEFIPLSTPLPQAKTGEGEESTQRGYRLQLLSPEVQPLRGLLQIQKTYPVKGF